VLKNSSRTALETIPVPVIKTSHLQETLYWEIIALYFETRSYFFSVALRPNVGHGLLILEIF
jgi:hypothetical protein